MVLRPVVWILAALPLLAALGTGCGDASAPGLERRSSQEVNATAPPEPRRGPAPTSTTPASGADAGDPGYRDPQASDAGCGGPTNKICGGKCVSIANEVGHCGDCNRACTGPSALCLAGSCSCGDIGFVYCANLGGCIDASADNNNCGNCGVTCNGNQTCRNSQCVDVDM